MSDEPGQGGLSPAAAWSLALAATATMAVSYVDRQALSVLAPTITRALAISDTAYGWLASAFAVAYLVCAPLAGRFIDRVGARRGLLLSVLVWSTVAAAHALVPGMWSLFVLRILLGAAEAPSFPAAAQTVSRALPLADRGAGFGILFTGSSFGAMVAPPLATWLEARWGWRFAMLGTAAVGLSWVPLWLWATGGAAQRRVMAVRAPAVGAAHFRWRALLEQPAVMRAVLAVVASAPGLAYVMMWGAKVMVSIHGLRQEEIGHYLWFPPVLFDVGAVGFGALATLRERAAEASGHGAGAPHRVLMALAATLACSLGALGFARTPWETTLLFGVAMAGGGGIYALATADMMRRVDPAWVAAAGGITAAAQSLAQIIAHPLIGRVKDVTQSYLGIAVVLGAWVVPGVVAWILWNPQKRE